MQSIFNLLAGNQVFIRQTTLKSSSEDMEMYLKHSLLLNFHPGIDLKIAQCKICVLHIGMFLNSYFPLISLNKGVTKKMMLVKI